MTKFLHCLSALHGWWLCAILRERARVRCRDHNTHGSPCRRQHRICNVLLSHPYGMNMAYLKMRLLKMQIFHILLPHNIYAMARQNAWAVVTTHTHTHTLAHTLVLHHLARYWERKRHRSRLAVQVYIVISNLHVYAMGTITTWLVGWLPLLQSLAIIVVMAVARVGITIVFFAYLQFEIAAVIRSRLLWWLCCCLLHTNTSMMKSDNEHSQIAIKKRETAATAIAKYQNEQRKKQSGIKNNAKILLSLNDARWHSHNCCIPEISERTESQINATEKNTHARERAKYEILYYFTRFYCKNFQCFVCEIISRVCVCMLVCVKCLSVCANIEQFMSEFANK